MKPFIKIFLLSCTLFLLNSCGKQSNNEEEIQMELTIDQMVNKANVACNSPAPQQSLGWLSDIIKKAEEDKLTLKHKGNYIGRIFLTSYRNQPVFYIRMMTDNAYAQVYDCSGKPVTVSEGDVNGFHDKAQQGTLIYSNMP